MVVKPLAAESELPSRVRVVAGSLVEGEGVENRLVVLRIALVDFVLGHSVGNDFEFYVPQIVKSPPFFKQFLVLLGIHGLG